MMDKILLFYQCFSIVELVDASNTIANMRCYCVLASQFPKIQYWNEAEKSNEFGFCSCFDVIVVASTIKPMNGCCKSSFGCLPLENPCLLKNATMVWTVAGCAANWIKRWTTNPLHLAVQLAQAHIANMQYNPSGKKINRCSLCCILNRPFCTIKISLKCKWDARSDLHICGFKI